MTALVPLASAASEAAQCSPAATAPDSKGDGKEPAGKGPTPPPQGPGRFPQVLDGLVTKDPVKKSRTSLPPWMAMLVVPALAPAAAKDPVQFGLAPGTSVEDGESKSIRPGSLVNDLPLSLLAATPDIAADPPETVAAGEALPVLGPAPEKGESDPTGAVGASTSDLSSDPVAPESPRGIRAGNPTLLPNECSAPQPKSPDQSNPVEAGAGLERWQAVSPEPLPVPAVGTNTPLTGSKISSQGGTEGAPSPSAVAFAVRLTPNDAPKPSAGRRSDTAGHTAKVPEVGPEITAPLATAADTRHAPSDEQPQRAVRRFSDPDKDRTDWPEATVVARSTTGRPQEGAVLPAAETVRDSARPPARPQATEPLRPAAEAAPPGATHPAAPAAAREIHLQMSAAGEPRVEVRVSERAGAVQVAVRTPDSRLSGAMRDDLPALSARLEQTGFRAEVWQPAVSAERHLQMVETRSAAATQNDYPGSGQSGHSQQRGQESPRRPPAPPSDAGSDTKGFSWLLSSFR